MRIKHIIVQAGGKGTRLGHLTASDASFLDLFHQALARCGVIFSLVNLRLLLRQPPDLKEMEEHKKISPGTVSGEIDFTDLIEELGSFSYHSGLATD